MDGIIPLFFALDLSISLDGIIPLFFALDLSISLDGIIPLFFSIFLVGCPFLSYTSIRIFLTLIGIGFWSNCNKFVSCNSSSFVFIVSEWLQ